jgi:hypothetical protein
MMTKEGSVVEQGAKCFPFTHPQHPHITMTTISRACTDKLHAHAVAMVTSQRGGTDTHKQVDIAALHSTTQ